MKEIMNQLKQPVVLHERSLEDDPLPEETTPDVPLTYEVIEKGSQKGADQLVDIMGYSYNVKDRRGKCTREKALWKALRHVFPQVSLSGCVFHWSQAVWSHVQNHGLATQYSSDRGTHSFIRKLLSLPFLPSEHTRPTFEAMKEFNNSETIEPLLAYIDRHWFNSPVRSVEEWCVYGQAVRTNNDVEGWHRRLNTKTGVAPRFYVLIDVLHREAKEVEEQVHLVTELSLRRIQRNSYRTMQSKLFIAWDAYQRKELSTTGHLKKVAVMYTYRTSKD